MALTDDLYDYTLSPEEVLKIIEQMDITKITMRTLNDWAAKGLIPRAIRYSNGYGNGTYALYPSDTPAEFYASWNFVYRKKKTKEKVAMIRYAGIHNLNENEIGEKFDFEPYLEPEPVDIMLASFEWLTMKETARKFQDSIKKINDKLNCKEILDLLPEDVRNSTDITKEIIKRLELANELEKKYIFKSN
jgi:hypothetical protein